MFDMKFVPIVENIKTGLLMIGGLVAEIKNEKDFQSLLQKSMEAVLKGVSEKIYKLLLERIRTDVYTATNKWYHGGTASPTYEFLHAWEWKPITKSLGKMATELFYNPNNVNYDGSTWKHGNPLEKAVDSLPAILNLEYMENSPDNYDNPISGWTSGLMFGDRHFSHFRKPYWSLLLNELFSKKEIEKMIIDELKSVFGSSRIIVTGTPG